MTQHTRTAYWAIADTPLPHGSWFMPAFALLAAFYAGTWLNSPYQSLAGHAVVLVLATTPACISAAFGFAVGRHLATRRVELKKCNHLPGEAR